MPASTATASSRAARSPSACTVSRMTSMSRRRRRGGGGGGGVEGQPQQAGTATMAPPQLAEEASDPVEMVALSDEAEIILPDETEGLAPAEEPLPEIEEPADLEAEAMDEIL